MNLIDIIKTSENEFPKEFSSFVEKEYGILFYDETNKDSYDSNHAILFTNKDFCVKETLKDITKFYLEKLITPRIYQPFENGYFEKHKVLLESMKYKTQIFGYNQFMLLTNENKIKIESRLTIKRLLEWDESVLLMTFLFQLMKSMR